MIKNPKRMLSGFCSLLNFSIVGIVLKISDVNAVYFFDDLQHKIDENDSSIPGAKTRSRISSLCFVRFDFYLFERVQIPLFFINDILKIDVHRMNPIFGLILADSFHIIQPEVFHSFHPSFSPIFMLLPQMSP
jgi:hypothetical protein